MNTNYYKDIQLFYKKLQEIRLSGKSVRLCTAIDDGIVQLAMYDGDEAYFLTEYSLNSNENIWKEHFNRNDLTYPSLYTVGGYRYFEELVGKPYPIVICGAGYVSLALIKAAKLVGFEVIVVEDRPYFCEQALLSGADQVVCKGFSEGLQTLPVNTKAYYVIVTRGHQHDVECMHQILEKDTAYIGLMGSKRRVATLKNQLIIEGYDEETIEKIKMPIGLSIGAQTPEEIAIAIIAQIIETKYSQNANIDIPQEILTACVNEKQLKKAMATIVTKRGSGPRNPGTRMLVNEDGTTIGTIGGGYAEAKIKEYAVKMIIEQQKKQLYQVNMTGEEAATNGLVCGGIMEILIQKLN